MENDESGRPPARDEPPEGDDGFQWPSADDAPGKVGRTAVYGLLAAIFGRIMLFHSLVPLFVGAGLLMGAWSMVRGELDRRQALAAFTGRAPAVIEAPWWRLDFYPEILGDGNNWLVATRASACARLRFRPEGGEETTTAYCRRYRRGALGEHSFTWEHALGPVPARWVDANGMPRIEMRLDRSLVRWLEARGPEADILLHFRESFQGPERARRSDRLLGETWRDLDDPFFRLLTEWSKPPPTVTVAYPPGDPARAAPLPLLRAEFTVPTEGGGSMPGSMLAVILGFFGLAFWGAGCFLATGQSRWATAVLVVGGLAVLPWASDHAGRVLGHLFSEAEMALDFIQTEMLGLPPDLALAAAEEETRARAEAEPFVWDLERSIYAPLLHWLEPEPPPEPMNDDGVLRHLADQVHRQAAALPDEELAELLAWVTSVQERGAGEEIGLLFVDAALDLRHDETRSEDVRYRAEELLHAVASHEPSVNPYRLATAERRRILERLPGS